MSRDFNALIRERFAEKQHVCVGLDTDYDKLPAFMRQRGAMATWQDRAAAVLEFNNAIVMATHDLVCAYKPNAAFYEKLGDYGPSTLRHTVEFINREAPGVVVIEDGKRGDIESTNDGYVFGAFEHRKADAVTVSPYLGGESLGPFLARKDKAIFVLCRTSNKGSGEFQALKAENHMRMFEIVADNFFQFWNKNGNVCFVAGAGETNPEDIRIIRSIIGSDFILLVPGIGKQGGSVQHAVRAAWNASASNFIINSSRDIIYASGGTDFAEVARQKTLALHTEITNCFA